MDYFENTKFEIGKKMTKAEVKVETKDQILEVALHLFAKYGFEGTSVRVLAEQAQVNVAAINYHFGSKHNLYWAVMNRSHGILKSKINEISENSSTIEDLMVGVFNFVAEDPAVFRSTIKMMLTEGVPDPDPEYYDASCEQGPPGIESIGRVLMAEIKITIPPEDMIWAVRAIFGNLFHWCTICSTTKMQVMNNNKKMPVTLDDIRSDIKRTTAAIKFYLLSSNQ
jgi:AcrR family transcriptional regulator